MGTFGWPVCISGMDEHETRELEAIVGTGAAYTTLPARLLRELGGEPSGRRRFLLADGRRTDMDYGQAWVAINGERVVTIVVFGEDEAPPLLGAYTLDGSALTVAPVEQRLVPTRMILYPEVGGEPRHKHRPPHPGPGNHLVLVAGDVRRSNLRADPMSGLMDAAFAWDAPSFLSVCE